VELHLPSNLIFCWVRETNKKSAIPPPLCFFSYYGLSLPVIPDFFLPCFFPLVGPQDVALQSSCRSESMILRAPNPPDLELATFFWIKTFFLNYFLFSLHSLSFLDPLLHRHIDSFKNGRFRLQEKCSSLPHSRPRVPNPDFFLFFFFLFVTFF